MQRKKLISISIQKGNAKDQNSTGRKAGENEAGTSARGGGGSGGGGGAAAGNQQQDWSILWSCFDNPLTLLATSESLPKGMQVNGNF